MDTSCVFECLIWMTGAAAFGLPLDLQNGPPPQLPPLSRYEQPTFPDQLRLTSIADGYATMMFTIDDAGRVADSIAIEASHPAFADAMQDAFRNGALRLRRVRRLHAASSFSSTFAAPESFLR